MQNPAGDPKSLLKEFNDAAWPEPGQMEQFVERAVAAQNFPIEKAFESLSGAAGSTNLLEFKKRLACFEAIAGKCKRPAVAEFLDLRGRGLSPSGARRHRPHPEGDQRSRLASQGDPPAQPQGHRRAQGRQGDLRHGRRRTVFQTLGEGLKRRTLEPRMEVIETMAQIAGHHALPLFKEVFPRAGRPERIGIINIIGNEHFMKAVRRDAGDFLIGCCADAEPSVVKAAIRMLGQIGTAEQLPVLMEMGGMPGMPHLQEVIEAVGRLAGEGNREVIELLEMAIRSKRLNLQLAGIQSLHQIGTSDVLPALSISLRDENIQVRQKGADAFIPLAKAGKVEIGRLLIFLLRERDANVRRIAVEIIDSVSKQMPDLWKNLIRHLRDADWWVRERVTDVLVGIGGEQIVSHVVALLDDPKEIMRRYAIEVLVRVKSHAALPRLLQAAGQEPTGGSASARSRRSATCRTAKPRRS